MGWLFFLAVLGTIMAIPMKRQMINIEKLRFPSGTAAAETLKSLYGAGSEAIMKARSLFAMMGIGAVIAWLRDAHGGRRRTRSSTALTKLSVKIPRSSRFPAQDPRARAHAVDDLVRGLAHHGRRGHADGPAHDDQHARRARS